MNVASTPFLCATPFTMRLKRIAWSQAARASATWRRFTSHWFGPHSARAAPVGTPCDSQATAISAPPPTQAPWQAAIVGSIAPTVVPPPDISTKLTRLNLFGRYALEKNSGVRFDYIFDRYKTDDWTWTTWMYADGTRLTQDPNQSVNFFGVTYYYRWQ